MADYSKMTQQEFDGILEEICNCDLTIPGVYEACSEELNNEVLDEWAERNPEKAWPEEEV
jgi:hypothetical protein